MTEQDLPIDINAGKLLDWLINRRHCIRGWQTNILLIREKINNAIQDMPEHEGITKLLTGTHINYFHCKKIIEILKETEADTKNLFGSYGSQRMKDWQEIVRLYEKDNLYLAEAAQMLIRNINYEVPNFKKQIQKCEQTANELEKKTLDCRKSENTAKTDFGNSCKQLGIPGQKIKRELVGRVGELADIYAKISARVECLAPVVEFYSTFVEFTLGRSRDNDCVPMIQYVIDKGNTTTYEWTYGEAPLSIVEPPLNINLDDEDKVPVGDENTLDLGEPNENAEIDFGDEVNLDEGGEIDWGDIEGEPAGEGAIDFNISLEESGIVVEAAGNEGGTATGDEALTVLDNPKTRKDFIDQLLELQAFLKMRLYELKSDRHQSVLSTSLMQEASPIIQMATADTTQNMLDNVQVILSEILDSRVQHLHSIKHSPRYVDVLAANLEQKLVLVERMATMQKVLKDKQQEARSKGGALKELLEVVIQKTRELQIEIEKDISKKYKNRKVHLTGSISAL
ncbi:CDK5 regulatory subunit-associated protein 3 [Fopius arisanus]|uniref:CDK5 regulatory subunit-associated protein 3 n=1 Tax=Fopius arisanus TaxID=64838 RepID=A0A9R1SX81_9HYME|nr:PREDICTED: CDK5 regulatory subunit-associated protein 3 [Fopius arisanus]